MIIFCVVMGIMITLAEMKDQIEYCDNEYGENNWWWNEITGTKQCPGIGQCWECIPNNTIIKEK